MKTRKVFSNGGVCEAWARGVEGRNAKGSLYTDGVTIWSYGSHFPIVSKVRGRWGGTSLVWWNQDRYSNTTAKQKSQVGSFVRGERIPVPTSVFQAILGAGQDAMTPFVDMVIEPPRDFEAELPMAINSLREAFKAARCVKAGAKFEEALRELETKRLFIGLAKGL